MKTDSIVLQERDFLVLRELFEARVLTVVHLGDLHFSGSREAAKKRLQKLKTAGLVTEMPRRVSERAVLTLTRKGVLTLEHAGILGDYENISPALLRKRERISPITLSHELAVMDVKASISSAVFRTNGLLRIAEFCTWPELIQFDAPRIGMVARAVTVKPDGFLRIHERDAAGSLAEYTFFLEVDRSTEKQLTLANRAISYLEYFRSGGFAVRNGASRSAYKDFPFRALFVFLTPERRNNTAVALLQLQTPIRTQAWLTTLPEIIKDPLGPIWVRPLDYQNATNGTRFQCDPAQNLGAYRRQSERERLVEERIERWRLLE